MLATGYRPDPHVVVQRRPKFHLLKAGRGLGVSPLPLATNNRAHMAPSVGGPGILQQGNTNACEGHAHASGVTLRYAIQGTPIPLASPICIYQGALMLQRGTNPDGTLPPLRDDGTEPSLIIQAMRQWGIASAAKWGNFPADPATICNEPTLAQLETAGDFELTGAYFLESSGDQFCTDLMTALAAGYVCTGAIAASGAAFQSYSGGVLPALDNAVDHATLWVDYSWDGSNLSSLVVYGVNSWGEGWGESSAPGIGGGMYRASRDFVAKYSGDCAVLDVSQYVGGP